MNLEANLRIDMEGNRTGFVLPKSIIFKYLKCERKDLDVLMNDI